MGYQQCEVLSIVEPNLQMNEQLRNIEENFLKLII